MTPRERVIAAIKHRETDRVPLDILFESPDMQRDVLRHFGAASFNELGLQHIVTACPSEPRQYLPDGRRYRDLYGCVWEDGSIWHLLDAPLEDPARLGGYTFPDYAAAAGYDHLADLRQKAPGRFIVANPMYFGGNERGWMLTGFENWLTYMLTEETFVQAVVEAIHRQAMASIQRLATLDIDAINCGPGDSGSQRGLLMSPDLWRKYFRRPWREEIELCRRHGFYVYTHACGDNTAIMDDMVDLGVDIYNPLQPECMDIRAMKARYGGRIAYHGGIGTQHLPYTDPATIRREVKATVALMRQGGGYIAAPAKPLFPDVPLANAVALVEAMLEAGGYR